MTAVNYHYDRFPPTQLDYTPLIFLIGPANAAIARYDGVLSAIPNAKILLSPLTTQEAVLSSKIEGTQATMGEVLEFEAEGDKLIQLAILHAEFEALHPFLDGNGRLGRMLIPLYLYQAKLIQSPTFYISAYFEANREEYYDRLLAISRNDDWQGWCHFFLTAITVQAQENQNKAIGILNLYNNKKDEITELTRSQYGIRALDWLFERPIFKSTDFTDSVAIPKPTARRILTILRSLISNKLPCVAQNPLSLATNS